MTHGTTYRRSNLGRRLIPALLALTLTASVFGCAAGTASRGTRGSSAREAAKPKHVPLIPEAYQYFTIGNMYSSAGNDSLAVDAYRRALSYDIKSREIRLALAQSYARLGRFDDAAITVDSIHPRDPEVMRLLASLYAHSGDFPRRLNIYEEWAKIEPDNEDVWKFLVTAYTATRDTTKLLGALDGLVAVDPSSAALSDRGFIRLTQNQVDSAAADFHRAIAIDTSRASARAMLGLAQVAIDRNQQDSAHYYFSEAVKTDYYNAGLRKRYVYFLIEQKRNDEAMENARLVLQMAPDEPDMLYRLGILEFGADQLDSAEIHLTQLITKYKDDGITRLLLGRIAAERGDTVTAVAQYEQSLALADTIPDTYVALGFVYNQRKQYDTCIALYETGLQKVPDDPGLLFGLGSALERHGDFDSSVTVFEHLIKLQPEHAPALNYLGYMFADKDIRLREALKLIERAVALQPKNGAILDSYGWVLYRLGDSRRAADQLLEAVKLDSSDAIIYEHLGDVMADLGRHDEADNYYRRALKLEPENEAIKKKLER